MIKIFRRFSFFIFVLLQLSFLLSIFFERMGTPLVISFLVVISLLITLAYFKAPRDEEEHFLEDVFIILYVNLGAIAAYALNLHVGLGPVIAAGLTGTIASYIPLILKKNKNIFLLKEIPAAVYCGSFVGMTAPNVAPGLSFIIFAGFIAGVLLIISKNIFNGFGGKLGTVAFGGVALTSYLLYLIF
jgi:hypothetical protein